MFHGGAKRDLGAKPAPLAHVSRSHCIQSVQRHLTRFQSTLWRLIQLSVGGGAKNFHLKL